MAKARAHRDTRPVDGSKSGVSPGWTVALVALAFATGALAMVQWLELIRSLDGAEVVCDISGAIGCSRVWHSDFAKSIHRLTFVPLAGWGLMWSLAAFASSLGLVYQGLARKPTSSGVAAVRWVAAAGVGACIVFLGVSIALGSLCPTCAATYVLVALYAVSAFQLPAETWLDPSGLRLPVAAVAVAYALVLWPGMQTPLSANDAVRKALEDQRADTEGDAAKKKNLAELRREKERIRNEKAETATTDLGRFLTRLPGPAKRAVADALASYRTSRQVSGDSFGDRPVHGPESAPLRIVDFVDVGCTHCAHLRETLAAIRKELPDRAFSVETRFFPLDGACNSALPSAGRGGESIRCLGAKLLVCAQGDPAYEDLTDAVFEKHGKFTEQDLYAMAVSTTGRSRSDLESCVASPKTSARLAEDVEYAKLFNPRGTPVVVLNGREGEALPPFLYAMVLAEGDVEAKGFAEAGLR